MKSRSVRLAMIALCLARSGTAQSTSTLGMLGTNLRYSAQDAWAVWTSPLDGVPEDWLIAGGSVALSAVLLPLDDNIDRWAYKHRDDAAFRFLKPLRNGNALYAGKVLTPVGLGLLAISVVTKSQSMQEALLGCATAYASNSLARNFVIYQLVARRRPEPRMHSGSAPPAVEGDQYQFAVPGTRDWGDHSAPGGHISNIAACGASLTRYYVKGPGAAAVWALVGGVGLARTLDRAHWASDEVLGLALGVAIGREIALRTHRRSSSSEPDGASSRGPALVRSRGMAVRLEGRLSF